MDIVCADLDYIPKEFIFGYYVDSDDKWKDTYFDKTYLPGEKHEHIYYDLVRNPNFCNGELVNDELFDLIKKILEEKEFKSYSDACVKSIENLDITYFEEEFMRNRIYFGQHFGWVGMSESYRDLLEDIHKDLVIRINCLPNENSLKK